MMDYFRLVYICIGRENGFVSSQLT